MEPVTHALASLALGRTGLSRMTRRAAPMLLVSGLAADLDWVSYAWGAPGFLAWHRTASHSLLGGAVIAVAAAAGFSFWGRRQRVTLPMRFGPALVVCAAGAVLHLLLDLGNSEGVKLLWPFSARWFAWDLTETVDPGLLLILLAGILLPALTSLISEEIGGRAERRPGQRGAIIALSLAALYMGGRALLHQRADALLSAHIYRGEEPIRTGAFPTFSPLLWRGVVETEGALHQVEVPVSPGARFDPRTARSQFKPEESPALARAVSSDAMRAFLTYARFPLARVEPAGDGWEVRIRDLRQLSAGRNATGIVAVITMNAQEEITGSALEFESSAGR
jgi:inner membrane protein